MNTITTMFGAKLQGSFDEQLAAANALGIKYIRPNGVDLSIYNGFEQGIDKWFDAGIGIVQNINYKESSAPIPYCTDLVWYRDILSQFLEVYAKKIDVAVIENEPQNDSYFKGPISNYVAQLKVAVEVCHKYAVKITDGSINIAAVNMIAAGIGKDKKTGKYKNKNIQQTADLITAYKTIPLDWVNVHAMISSKYHAGDIMKAVKYLRAQTGHQVMSNEHHYESGTPDLLTNTINEWRDAEVAYCLVWGGGGGSPADALNTGGSLTALGTAYKNAII